MDPITISIIVVSSATLIIQIAKLIKRSKCANCVLEMREDAPDVSLDLDQRIKRTLELYQKTNDVKKA